MTGCSIHLKKEQSQVTGSFKERGARNAIMSLSEEQRRRGVIAASAGNHALALAWHGSQLGVPVTVVMPTVAPMTKVQNCRLFGANIIIHGDHIGEAKDYALQDPALQGLTYINGYDDVEVIAGTGTLGIEMLEQVPDCEVLVVPIGGGGLIAGIALAAKTLNPAVQVGAATRPRRGKSRAGGGQASGGGGGGDHSELWGPAAGLQNSYDWWVSRLRTLDPSLRPPTPTAGGGCEQRLFTPLTVNRSADPFAKPIIEGIHLGAAEDVASLRHGIRLGRQVCAAAAFDEYRGEEVFPGAAVQSDEQIDEYIRSSVHSANALTSSCRMGDPSDPAAVLDSHLRVRGVGGLRVADASAMPRIIGGQTQAPTYMLAERAADILLHARLQAHEPATESVSQRLEVAAAAL